MGGVHKPWVRWWILFWYSYISALQSLVWFTWSSVPDDARAYLHCSDETLEVFLDEGPIAYLVTVFFAGWLLTRPNGLQKSVRLAGTVAFLASVIRSVPLLFTDGQRQKYAIELSVAVHVGQTLNAGLAPLVVASPR